MSAQAGQQYDVFISYSRSDQEFARQLTRSIITWGARVWIDSEEVRTGVMSWARQIHNALESSKVIIVIISPESMESKNVEEEWGYFHDNNKPIIPVLWIPTKVHFQLARLQYVDFSTLSYDTAISQLYGELSRNGIQLAISPEGSTQIPSQPPLPVQTGTFPAVDASDPEDGTDVNVQLPPAIHEQPVVQGYVPNQKDRRPTCSVTVVIGFVLTLVTLLSALIVPAVFSTSTATPTPSATPTSTDTPTNTPSVTFTSTNTATHTPTPLPSPTTDIAALTQTAADATLDTKASEIAETNTARTAEASRIQATTPPVFTPRPTGTATPTLENAAETAQAHLNATVTEIHRRATGTAAARTPSN